MFLVELNTLRYRDKLHIASYYLLFMSVFLFVLLRTVVSCKVIHLSLLFLKPGQRIKHELQWVVVPIFHRHRQKTRYKQTNSLRFLYFLGYF